MTRLHDPILDDLFSRSDEYYRRLIIEKYIPPKPVTFIARRPTLEEVQIHLINTTTTGIEPFFTNEHKRRPAIKGLTEEKKEDNGTN